MLVQKMDGYKRRIVESMLSLSTVSCATSAYQSVRHANTFHAMNTIYSVHIYYCMFQLRTHHACN